MAHVDSCPVDLSIGPDEIHSATHRGDILRSNLDNEIIGKEREFCSKYQIDLPIKHVLRKSRKSLGCIKNVFNDSCLQVKE